MKPQKKSVNLLIKHYNLFESEPDIFDNMSQNQKLRSGMKLKIEFGMRSLMMKISPKNSSSSNHRMLDQLYIFCGNIVDYIKCRILFFQK
jgi:hypothetical protein